MEKSREENIIDSQKGNKDENHFTHKIATEANKKRRRDFIEKMIGLLCAFLLVGSILSYAIITKATAIDYQLSSDGSYYIVESVSRYVSRISVPKKHKGLPVKEIGDSAFQGRDLLKRVKIPSTVTRIGQKAFFGCNSLKKVEIEKGLEVIGDYAFACASSLSEIYLPDSVEQLSMGVFSFCNSLKEVRLSEELTDIGSNAFSDCTSLTNVKIPDSVTIINQNAFNGCKTLKNVVIGKGVTQIGKGAFYNCKNLIEVLNYSRLSNETISETGLDAALCIHNGQTKVEKANGFMFITVDGENYLFDYEANDRRVVLPKDYKGEKYNIYKSAFSGNSKIRKLIVSQGVKSIGEGAFYCCANLKKVTVLDGVQDVGDYAFNYCPNLKRVKLGKDVKAIGDYAFYGDSSSLRIKYNGTVEDWAKIEKGKDYVWGVLYRQIKCADGKVRI